jgi:hypothetical protein
MSYNMMIGYDIYDCFTMEHFRLRQRMTLTINIYCSRLYISKILDKKIGYFFNGNTFFVSDVTQFYTDIQGNKYIFCLGQSFLKKKFIQTFYQRLFCKGLITSSI